MIVDSPLPHDDKSTFPFEHPPAYTSNDYSPQTSTSSEAISVKPIDPSLVTHRVVLPAMPPTTVYHYMHPRTNEHIASLLPPDHPEMICLQEGGHLAQTKFGVLGLLAAVFWFPLGIGLCMLDRRVKCRRCGIIIDNGVCGG